MKIGNIEFGKYPIFLAPMEDVTDLGFRLLCKRFGVDMVYTEFVSSDALIRRVNKTMAKLELDNKERPVAIQIYGREVDAMTEAAKIVEEMNPDIIDINFGCPVKKVAGKGAGSGLLKTPEKMVEITKAVVEAVKLPVTIKTRLGWDDNSKIIVDLAEQIQDVGAQAITIHGRTRAQMYTGHADWSLIGEVKKNPRMKIPIIGNGDLQTPDDCKARFEETGVDAIMVGRASIGCPWIFEEMKHFLLNNEYLPRQDFAYYTNILKELLLLNVEKNGERGGIIHTRRHLAATPLYKGINDFKRTRIEMLRAENVGELLQIMDEIPERFEINY